MINDILDSSKLKAGKMGLNLKSLRVKDEVEKVVHSLRSAKVCRIWVLDFYFYWTLGVLIK